ncbi:MAG: pyruvate, phosphate dikinase, partial [Acidimicrobiia bacterium]
MKYVYGFDEGSKEQKFLLGGKGANLAEMTKLGLPVPSGFTISTEACKAYMHLGEALPDGLLDQVAAARTALESTMDKTLGDGTDPLLVSVRSGAAFSMPGMMDTVLNLGLNDASVQGLAKQTTNERFAYDSYRRFVQMFGKIVLNVPAERFEHALEAKMHACGVDVDTKLSSADLMELVAEFKGIVLAEAGVTFPDDPAEQLRYAIEAVFKSWNGRRARDYRKLEGISDDLGTAVNVQAMVFGNKGDDSGTGVAFTRNPSTGEAAPYGDFLTNAQGEDVVAGIRITEPLTGMGTHFPECHTQLLDVMARLEAHYHDMCDIEFTIEQGRLFILQTRVGKRTAAAALRMAVEMETEGLIDKKEAVLRVQPAQLDQLLHPQFDPGAKYDVLATGLNASPGAAVGKVYFTADEAQARHEAGEAVILVRPETSPDDLHGMIAAEGILTSRGGLVSHAAVVARGMGKPAICGAESVKIDLAAKTFRVGDITVTEGEVISIDGSTGVVVLGAVPVVVPEPTGPFGTILGWADEFRTLKVRTNADLPEDAAKAVSFGAQGIGLCRAEHMFLGDRLPVVQRMIL